LQRVCIEASSDEIPALNATISLATFSPAAVEAVAKLQQEVESAVRTALLHFTSAPCSVKTELVPRNHARPAMKRVGSMSAVGSIIAVASGKGGVGKSTVAVNLAFALARLGARVGIFDADIYGPSLPLMVSPASTSVVKRADGLLTPLVMDGVRLMSYGYVSPRNGRGERGGAVLRGPMVSQVVSQLCRFTDWGALDHLIVDMPPGTGDIHITLGQTLPFTTSVIVSTPQGLALADVKKGLDMFRAMRVPSSAIVLNMSHFDAPDTGVRYFPFGAFAGDKTQGPLATIAREHGISHMSSLPIDPLLSTASDIGIPVVISAPESATAAVYAELAAAVAFAAEERAWSTDAVNTGDPVSAHAGMASSNLSLPESTNDDDAVQYSAKIDSKRGGVVLREFSLSGARESVLNAADLRKACRCAACVDEVTGECRIKLSSVPADIRAVTLTPQGNYGVLVKWSDGHLTGIYSYSQLRELASSCSSGRLGT
jgi:Mrp family chromosome partitioning ATPase/DUF971 family protein